MTHPEILRAERTGYPKPYSNPQIIRICDCGRSIYQDDCSITCSICGVVGCNHCIEKDWIDNVNICDGCETDLKEVCEKLNNQADEWERLFKKEAMQKQNLIRELETIYQELSDFSRDEMKETILLACSVIKGKLAFIVKHYKERLL